RRIRGVVTKTILRVSTIIAAALLAECTALAQQRPDGAKPVDVRAVDVKLVREYLDKMQLKYVPHPKSPDTLVVPVTENSNADRIDLYVEVRGDKTMVLSAYPKLRGKYFNAARATDREKLFQKLVETNFRSFASFFVDEQGDIGARFTFTTE